MTADGVFPDMEKRAQSEPPNKGKNMPTGVMACPVSQDYHGHGRIGQKPVRCLPVQAPPLFELPVLLRGTSFDPVGEEAAGHGRESEEHLASGEAVDERTSQEHVVHPLHGSNITSAREMLFEGKCRQCMNRARAHRTSTTF